MLIKIQSDTRQRSLLNARDMMHGRLAMEVMGGCAKGRRERNEN